MNYRIGSPSGLQGTILGSRDGHVSVRFDNGRIAHLRVVPPFDLGTFRRVRPRPDRDSYFVHQLEPDEE